MIKWSIVLICILPLRYYKNAVTTCVAHKQTKKIVEKVIKKEFFYFQNYYLNKVGKTKFYKPFPYLFSLRLNLIKDIDRTYITISFNCKKLKDISTKNKWRNVV